MTLSGCQEDSSQQGSAAITCILLHPVGDLRKSQRNVCVFQPWLAISS